MPVLDNLLGKITIDVDSVLEYLQDEFKEELHPRAKSGPHGGEFVPKGKGTEGVKEVAAEAHKRTHKSPVRFKLDKKELANGGKRITIQHGYMSTAIASEMKAKVEAVYKAVGGKVRQDRWTLIVDVDFPPKNQLTAEKKAELANLPKLINQVNSPKDPNVQEVSNNPSLQREKRISTTPIVSSKDLKPGEHVSETLKVEFADGSSGVFKSSKGEPHHFEDAYTYGYQTAREIGAWEVAKIVGIDNIVTPCVKTKYKGEEGALLDWQNGDIANNVWGDKKYDGDEDCAKAAVFDYVIGNSDRHSGNWLVDSSSGKDELRLIDHGLSFCDKEEDRPSSRFLDEMKNKMKNKMMYGKTLPLGKYAEIYADKYDEIVSKLKEVGLPDGSFVFLKKRINTLLMAKDWSYLK